MTDDDQTNPADTNREQELEAVIADYIRACEAGGTPDRRQILDGHPHLAADLRQFFAQRDRMHQMAAPIRDFSDELFQSVGPGQQISYVGNYELLEEIARGGMGVVYRARQVTLGRIVAVKMIMAGRLASDDDVQRFQVEAKAAAGLQHPHIVSIHEVGQHEGWHYFSMDFVTGRDLSAILRENLLPARRAATFVQQMAEAIHYAHQQGTLHRDLKPSNILIDRQDQVRITDFGLAMRVEGDSDLTRTGQIMGTPSYMPPEQAQGKRSLIGPGSDVYAMGAVLYECLTGRPPFRAQSMIETIEQVIHTDAPSPRLLNPGIPRDLETICLKCLQKEPHRRYGTAQLLAEDLCRFLRNEPILARPVGMAVRTWRWCRRKPVVASLSGLLLVSLLAVTGTSMLAYTRELAHSREIEGKKIEISLALEREKKSLYHSLVSQARANRLSRRAGQRFESLEVLREASRKAHEMNLPEEDFLELRNEAIACFTLADVKTAKEWDGWPSGTMNVDFDSNLDRYARVDRTGNISVRRVSDDRELWSLAGLGPQESWLTMSPDGKFLAVWRERFKIWNLAGPEPILFREGPGFAVFSPDNRRLVTVHAYDRLTLIELPSGKRIIEYQIPPPKSHIVFHPQLQQVAISTATGVQILEVETGKVLVHLPQVDAGNMAWHPDGKTLAVVGGDSNIYCWDIAARIVIVELKGHSPGTTLAYNRTGDRLASAGWGQPLRLWNPQTAEQVFRAPLLMRDYFRFSTDNRRLAADLVGKGRIRILEVACPESCYRTMIRDPILGVGVYMTTAISADGKLLASAMSDGVGLWDLASGRPLTFLQTGGIASSVEFEPSGALIASGQMGIVRWKINIDATDSKAIQIGPMQQILNSPGANAMGMSHDGRIVAQAMGWGGLVWDRNSLAPPFEVEHPDTRYIDTSPDGLWVATGSHSGTNVRIWDAKTGILAHELQVEGLSHVNFSSNSLHLVTSYNGNRLWSVETGQEGRYIGGGFAVAFSPDNQILAAEMESGRIRLMNPNTGRDYAILEDPHQHRAFQARFSSDGSQLAVTAQEAHMIHVWNLRAIREQLRELKLDWEMPAYDPAGPVEPLILKQPLSAGHSAQTGKDGIAGKTNDAATDKRHGYRD